MVRRYEISESHWDQIEHLLPGKASDPGRTAKDNRNFINGVLWVLRSGAPWADLPERYGKYKSVHKRYGRWCHCGIWEKIFKVLGANLDSEYLMLDSTVIRAHSQAAAYKKKSRDWVDLSEG
jgi:putative transposase